MSTSLIKSASATSLPISPSSEVPDVQLAKRPISPVVLPVAVLVLDVEVREGFLSDDIETICTAVNKSGSATILLIAAGKSLEDREAAFDLWRKKLLEGLQLNCGELAEFLSKNTAPELCASFRDGTVDLLALDSAIHDERERVSREAAELRRAQKEKLKEAFWSHAQGFVEHPSWPRYLVVRGDGELRLMKNLNQAKEWGRVGNLGYYTVPLQGDGIQRTLPLPE